MSSVRHLVHSARTERRGLRVGGLDPRMSGRWPVLSASIVLVFAGFFAIGHLSRSAGGDSSRAEAPSTLQAATGTGEIPIALNSAPPLEPETPAVVVTTPAKREHRQPSAPSISIRAPLSAPAPTQPLTPELTQRPEAVSKPRASSAPAPAPARAPAPKAAPVAAPTPTHSSSGRRSGSSGGGSGGGGGHSSGGGGSFDSSE